MIENVRWRALRASVFALATVLLGAGGHVFAGGPITDPTLIVVALVPTSCAGVVLARRSRSLRVLLPVVAAFQVLLHELFMAGSGTMDVQGLAAHAAMHDHASGPVTVVSTGAAMSAPGPLMLLAHVASVVLVAALMARGEQGLRILWSLLGLTAPAPRAFTGVVHAPAPASHAIDGCFPVFLSSQVSRRGPPTRAVAFA